MNRIDTFIKEMQRLVIKQYFGKPRAMSEIELYCLMIEDAINVLESVENKDGFPLDILSLLAGIAKPPSLKDADFLSLLRAIFAARNFVPTITGLQKVYSKIFNNKAILTDNLNGSFTITIDTAVSKELIDYFRNHSHRLPAPVGIRPQLQQQKLTDFFGFEDNPNSIGFGDKRPNTPKGGVFVEKI